MALKRLIPIHPGEILEDEFMRPLGLSASALAKGIDVPVTRVSEIVRGRRGITADTALRLGRFFGVSAELWLGLQSEHDLRVARRDFESAIVRRVIPLKAAARRQEPTTGQPSSTGWEVREPASPYGAEAGRRLDRRRRRRPR